ncbi:MAG: ABC transporter permease subunit [Treponema sp.]|jgi:NitT/TauT family transport system permease protein|nr:ABC transporter permease subunit [Treponema sp.]
MPMEGGKFPINSGGKKGGGRFSAPWFFLGVLFLFFLWELAARISGSEWILPGPLPVLKRFLLLGGTENFWYALGGTFLRVMLGIFISVPAGIIVGLIAGLDKRAGAFFSPLFSVIAATPVMSVILIAFLWLGGEQTPVFTAFLLVFPVMAANTIAGIQSADGNLRELFILYRLSLGEKLRFLYIPSLLPFITGGMESSLSLCWKVVVAAEVLVQPLRALGTGMQTAKSRLETPELFAWTIGTVAAAALSQGIFSFAFGLLKRMRRRP